jgi:hypothetical protein
VLGIEVTQLPLDEHRVVSAGIGTKALHHPVVGDLPLDWDTLTATTDPDQHLVVWTAQPGSPTHDGLRLLASLAASTHLSASPSADGLRSGYSPPRGWRLGLSDRVVGSAL